MAIPVLSRHRSLNLLSMISRHLSSENTTLSEESNFIKTIYVEVKGIKIHCDKTGHGKHSVLLLPGALGSSQTDFGPQLKMMNKEKYTIFAFDPRGYGLSIPPERDWPLEYLQRDAEDAVEMMKSLQQFKFSILGWSDGGITGLIIAGRYPKLVHRLVVWGANAYIKPSDIPLLTNIENVSKWSKRMREPFVAMYGLEYFQVQWSNWIRSYIRYLEERHGNICIEDVKKIECPTLILHGQKDPIVVQEHPVFLHANIKNSRLINWPDGKHNLHLRFAEKFQMLVEEFLDEVHE